jgi:chorismate dehydratase
LNTKPLLYGIERAPVRKDIDLVIDYPARIAAMLLADEIDMGLVPVAVIPKMKEYYINGNHCIGSEDQVASVCLFSDVPLGLIRRVLLDYQSNTSVELVKILLKEYWKIDPELVDAGKDYMREIRGTTAGVVIGDRALEQRQVSPFIYDLAEGWKGLTGMPFVFAAWISNKKLDPVFIRAFDDANGQGIMQIDQVVAENPYKAFDLHTYFTHHLDYRLDERKRRGLERFLEYLGMRTPAAVWEACL